MTVSVIIPTFKRIEETLKVIRLLFASKAIEKFALEVIVADSTPNKELRLALKKEFKDRILYVRPQLPGIASNKNAGARAAHGEIVIFCDSDMEVEEDTIANTVISLEKYKTAGALGGQVFWRGGKRDGTLDRPRPEDRRENFNETVYAEAIYSRYLATYKKVFLDVGGYDEKVFNMRGEGSDLSIRYWRAGYPLVFDDSIKVHHVHDAPDSAALRISHPERGIAKDLLLLAYKYDMLDKDYENFAKTVTANFREFGEESHFRIIQGIGSFLDFITEMKPKIDEEKKVMKSVYDFKFLEVFSDKDLLQKCLSNAEELLSSARKPVL